MRLGRSIAIGLRGSRFRAFALPGRLALLLVLHADRLLEAFPAQGGVRQEAAFERGVHAFRFLLAPRTGFKLVPSADRNTHRDRPFTLKTMENAARQIAGLTAERAAMGRKSGESCEKGTSRFEKPIESDRYVHS
jgi:hypothetical protein